MLVTSDPALEDELRGALQGLSQANVVVHVAADLLRAVDLARSRRPQLAIVEMTGDMARLKSISAELQAACPEMTLTGAYRTDTFSPAVWERAAQGAVFVESLRAGYRDFLRRPISAGDLQQLLGRLHTSSTAQPSRRGVCVAFVSNKGGVGKTTLAVNVATRLAQLHPQQVLLVDCSLQIGHCAPMLDLRPTTTMLDAVRQSERLDPTLFRRLTTPHESGLDLLAAPPDAFSATEIDDDNLSRVLTLARRSYDFVVIDTFPLFDRIVMAVLDVAQLTYVVLENVVPTVLSAARMLELMDGLEYPIARRRVVANRFARHAGNPSLADIRETLQRDVDHLLPFDKRVVTSANVGRPFAMSPRYFSSLERGLNGIATEIESLSAVTAEFPGDGHAERINGSSAHPMATRSVEENGHG
ncbi:MAG: CpaE family protein [Planctomycetaceae bacterium]